MVYAPDWVKLGVQWKVAVLFALSTNVAPEGKPEAVRVTWSASASVALTLNESATPSLTLSDGATVTTGAWFPPPDTSSTVTTLVAVVTPPWPSFPVNVRVYAPDCVKLGVQWKVPVLFPLSTNVAPDGKPDALRVTWSASASVAVTVKVSAAPSLTLSDGATVTTGAWFPPPDTSSTVTTLVAVVTPPWPSFPVNVRVYAPDCVKLGVQWKVP